MKGNVRARDTQNCGAEEGWGVAWLPGKLCYSYSHGMLAAGFYINKAEEFLKQ